MDFKLLEDLVAVQGSSGDEKGIRDYLINYIENNKSSWKTEPKLIYGDEFQDCLILVLGKPKTAIYAHMDSIGFMVGYENNLIKIGGPKAEEGYELVGKDSQGAIDTEIMVIEDEEGNRSLKCVSDREFDRGTPLTFKPNFRKDEEYIQSPYMDNRLGVWVALQVARSMENGAIVFSTYEETGGNSVGFCASYLLDHYQIRQSLISDITWVTNGVHHNKGVAISMRDKGIPRRVFLNRIIEIASKSGISYQLEVESAGGSDGTVIQNSDMAIDWCFIGAPEDHVHSPNEKVHINDIASMIELYKLLMIEL